MKKYINIIVILVLVLNFSIPVFPKEKKPKNIIIMIGDGMGLNQVSAFLISDPNCIFKKFQSIGISITCSADMLITDSAAGATAISTGYKTNNHYLGVDPHNKPLQNIFSIVKKSGLSTGLVVTSTITHATPAAFYAHFSDRNNEEEIASQLSDNNIDVIIGGGAGYFLSQKDSGLRKDDKNLLEKFTKNNYTIVTDYTELGKVNSSKVIALLENKAIKPAEERDYTLADLTSFAIDKLSRNEKGFMLMVEGSQIDWGGHANSKKQVVNELADFQKAIKTAVDFAEKDGNTLIIVTADHETGGVSLSGDNRELDNIKFNFNTKDHSANCVGIFSFGPGEELFRGIMENNLIGRKVFSFFDKTITWK